MCRVIAICGKICCGKSYYANNIKNKERAVILSCDQMTSILFDNNLGDKHDEILKRIQKYLLEKSCDLINANCNVILDWGFWTKSDRDYVKKYFRDKNIKCEIHYVDIDDISWQKNIKERNDKILNDNGGNNYYLDDGLINKILRKWEYPTPNEIDVCYKVIR